MTTERIVSAVDWRAQWGLAPKKIYRCPECGVETSSGLRCKYHSNSRRNRRFAESARKAFRLSLIRALCDGVDEARAQP